MLVRMILVVLALLTRLGQADPLVLQNSSIRLVVETNGGGFVDLQLKGNGVNPFTWHDGTNAVSKLRGHFLCLDRWGAPSDAEKDNGMPFHGEAPRTPWRVEKSTADSATMSVVLPMAGVAVKREIRLSGASVLVTEWVTNQNKLGRLINMVQHPSIGPPFLDETTVVDANARKGFMQSSPMPNPEEPPVVWPMALKDSQPVDMRRLTDDPMPNVVSYVVDEEIGWTTAANAAKGLLVGYAWSTAEYPWFNAWRHVENGKPAARGLEFGTTGLHQPYPVLVKKGKIFGRALYTYLDAGETMKKQFQMFVMPVGPTFKGVTRLRQNGTNLIFEGIGGEQMRLEKLF